MNIKLVENTVSEDNQIAETIIDQLGGVRKLKAMLGVGMFIVIPGGVKFRFFGSKISNIVEIHLNGKDLYDIKFGKMNKNGTKLIKTFDDIYADQLIEIFEETAGLRITLFNF